MHYGPLHYDFRMRYAYRELPRDVLRRLENLAFIKDPDDLAAKYPQAIAWFREAIEAVDERLVRHRIFESRDATTDLGNDTPPGGDTRITRGARRTPGSTPSRGSRD